VGIQLYQVLQVATADNNDTGEPIKVINMRELGNYLQVSESCIRRWMAKDIGFPEPFTLGGNRLYWDITDVDDWINICRDTYRYFNSEQYEADKKKWEEKQHEELQD
jgi:predicted DNA-binding transcriptional regulator AlpA